MDTFDVIQIPLYYSENILNGKHWRFHKAEDVGTFMWGNFTGQFIIYKNKELAYLHHLYGNVEKLVEYLKGDINYPTVKPN